MEKLGTYVTYLESIYLFIFTLLKTYTRDEALTKEVAAYLN